MKPHHLIRFALPFAAITPGHAAPPRDGLASPSSAHAEIARRGAPASGDTRAFPDAPPGIEQPPADPARRGRVEPFDYDSTVTGTRRQANVYLPRGYSTERRYPVLYLLHGVAGNQHEWTGYVRADAILDHLIADGKAVPMIVVMPNGRALADDRPPPSDQVFAPENTAGFARFERDLLECLIPAIDRSFPTLPGREHRALAGLSMGGGQALNFGLAHLDTFAWVGGFSSAPNTRPPATLVSDPASVRSRLRLLYLSCGSQDGLLSVSRGLHVYLSEHDVPHVWNVDDHGHDAPAWRNNLHHFAQRIFR